MENNEIVVNSNILNGNEIDQSKLPAFKVKVYGTDSEEIEKEEFCELVDVRFWLPITCAEFVRLIMSAREWELHNEDGYILTKGRNQQFNKAKPMPTADEIAQFADTITWALGKDFTNVLEMSEEDLGKSKSKFLRLIYNRISKGVFTYMDFELFYIEKPIMLDGKRYFAPLVKTPVTLFSLVKGADGQPTLGVDGQPILRKSAYAKWERLLEDEDGEDAFEKMVLEPLNMIRLGTRQAFMDRFHNTTKFNRWYSMPLINFTNVIYSNGKADKDIFKKGRHDDEKKHTYSNNPNASNYYIFFIEKGELKMVKMDAKYYSHLGKASKA